MNTTPDVPPVINPYHTITYEFTRWDIFANWITAIVRNRLLQIFVPVSMVLYVGMRVLPQLRWQPLSQLLLDAIIDCVGFMAFLLFFQAIAGLASAFLMKHKGVVGQHTLEITEAGLIERTEVNETLHRWPGVCRMFSFLGYLFIYVGEHNVHQVPKRNLAPEVIANFETELRARMR